MVKDNQNRKDLICADCGRVLAEKSGKFGKFLGCTGFPKCRYTKSIKNIKIE